MISTVAGTIIVVLLMLVWAFVLVGTGVALFVSWLFETMLAVVDDIKYKIQNMR